MPSKTKAKDKRRRKGKGLIEVILYGPFEMAMIQLDGVKVFCGNYWDFHSGCHGSKIGGFDLEGKWDRGILSLAFVLKVEAEKKNGSDYKVVQKRLVSEKDYHKYFETKT